MANSYQPLDVSVRRNGNLRMDELENIVQNAMNNDETRRAVTGLTREQLEETLNRPLMRGRINPVASGRNTRIIDRFSEEGIQPRTGYEQSIREGLNRAAIERERTANGRHSIVDDDWLRFMATNAEARAMRTAAVAVNRTNQDELTHLQVENMTTTTRRVTTGQTDAHRIQADFTFNGTFTNQIVGYIDIFGFRMSINRRPTDEQIGNMKLFLGWDFVPNET